MGADGHIGIYDMAKIRSILTDEEIKIFLCDSTIYIQTLEGKEYLTVYWGDNLYYRGDDYDDKFGGYKNAPSREHFDNVWAEIKKFKLTEWEIWT